MTEEKKYNIPSPMVNKKERDSLVILTDRYNKLIKPSKLSKIGTKINDYIPEKIKQIGSDAMNSVTEAELFANCMNVVGEGFNILEKQAAKMTISESSVISKVNNVVKNNEITTVDEICFARSYDLAKIVNKYKSFDFGYALVEGGTTGFFGFAGLPFNLALSMFLYYRAVQSVAMCYGYDVKNDASELIIAGQVFMGALSPGSQGSNEISGIIGKVMLMTELTVIKQASKKTYEEMISKGGMVLLLVQMRALANKSAKKALEKAGQKGLENSLFRELFEQIGKKITKKSLGKAVPYFGAVIGALFDVAQMNTVLEYADVFYNKRFILEKEARITALINEEKIDYFDAEIIESEIES